MKDGVCMIQKWKVGGSGHECSCHQVWVALTKVATKRFWSLGDACVNKPVILATTLLANKIQHSVGSGGPCIYSCADSSHHVSLLWNRKYSAMVAGG